MLQPLDASFRPSIPETIPQFEQKLDPASQTGDFVLPSSIDLVGDGDAIGNLIFNNPTPKIEALTDYEMLLYHYADGRELEVYHPVSLSVRFDGAELITCADRVGVVAPSGYLKCERFPKFGKSCFPGHQPVHLIGD